MSITYKVLKSDTDSLTAALSQARVTVFELRDDLAGCIVDYGDPVQKWSPESIKIADTYYRRNEF